MPTRDAMRRPKLRRAEQPAQQHHDRHRDQVLDPLVVLTAAVGEPRALEMAALGSWRWVPGLARHRKRVAKRARQLEERTVAEPHAAAGTALPGPDVLGAFDTKRLHRWVRRTSGIACPSLAPSETGTTSVALASDPPPTSSRISLRSKKSPRHCAHSSTWTPGLASYPDRGIEMHVGHAPTEPM